MWVETGRPKCIIDINEQSMLVLTIDIPDIYYFI